MVTSEHAVKFELELFPGSSVYIALFKDVKNSEELKKNIMAGEIDAVLLSPKMIVDPFQLMVAANKALHIKKNGLKMSTRNVNTEVLFNLSPTRNISASFKRFGLSKEDSGLVVVTLEDDAGEKVNAVERLVQGDIVPLDELSNFNDYSLIKQVYKVDEEELGVCSLLDAVVSRMATKDAL
ncbi:EKC/KEOPS complex subunit Tprkb-like [Asterias amurensis]|uniref:EKC/KEOPS complex subunit Tprkb-like n=1 Tax=Asterias amurensis TaxID=7602 RepID=UPI003AB2563C